MTENKEPAAEAPPASKKTTERGNDAANLQVRVLQARTRILTPAGRPAICGMGLCSFPVSRGQMELLKAEGLVEFAGQFPTAAGAN